MGLYAVFIHIMKAFDTVNREALWKVLARMGCLRKLLPIIHQLHNRMMGKIRVNGSTKEKFGVMMGEKQGCVIALILFIIYFAAMVEHALRDSNDDVYLRTSTEGGIFNLARLRVKTKVREQLICDLLFADDCGLFAHCEAALQQLMDLFAKAATNFGLTVSAAKTEVMQCSTASDDTSATQPPLITVGDQTLKVVKQFKYLCGIISEDGQIDDDITNCIARASQSFG